MNHTVRFSDALVRAAEILRQRAIPAQWNPLLVRDVYGRLRVALDVDREEHAQVINQLEGDLESLGAFTGEPNVICRADVFDPRSIFDDASIQLFQFPKSDLSVRMLDRQVTGQDWLL